MLFFPSVMHYGGDIQYFVHSVMHYGGDIPYFVRSVMHYGSDDTTFLYLITHRINSNMGKFALNFASGFTASVDFFSFLF